MRKSLCITLAAIFMLTSIATGCTSKDNVSTIPSSSQPVSDETNPFHNPQGEEFMPSSVSHEPTSANLDENGNRMPFQYGGGEFQLDYTVRASGKAKNIGFLVYVDGVPQPYKINETDAPYEYMHIFDLPEDDIGVPFSFIFTPVTGKNGDILTLNIVSVYNPSFKPDMKDTMSYGMYHNILPMEFLLEYETSTEQIDTDKIRNKNFLQNVSVHTAPITSEMLATFGGGMRGALTLEDLSNDVFTQVRYNSKEAMDNLRTNNAESLHITYSLCGVPGVHYKTTFYINHEPISSADANNFTTTLSKCDISVMEADIDLSMLDDLSTFYAVSVPVNASDFPNEVIIIQKSMSILLYK